MPPPPKNTPKDGKAQEDGKTDKPKELTLKLDTGYVLTMTDDQTAEGKYKKTLEGVEGHSSYDAAGAGFSYKLNVDSTLISHIEKTVPRKSIFGASLPDGLVEALTKPEPVKVSVLLEVGAAKGIITFASLEGAAKTGVLGVVEHLVAMLHHGNCVNPDPAEPFMARVSRRISQKTQVVGERVVDAAVELLGKAESVDDVLGVTEAASKAQANWGTMTATAASASAVASGLAPGVAQGAPGGAGPGPGGLTVTPFHTSLGFAADNRNNYDKGKEEEWDENGRLKRRAEWSRGVHEDHKKQAKST